MALRDWFSRRSTLQLALERGLRAGGDLRKELNSLGEIAITSKADAQAICKALERYGDGDPELGNHSSFHSLVGLFQDVEDTECDAYPVMRIEGIRTLVRIVQTALKKLSKFDESDVLFALKILAMYGTRDGTDLVIRAARLPLRPESYMWSVILGQYTANHPESDRLFRKLSDPMPEAFIAVSLLDAANTAAREGANYPHCFDTPAGVAQLEHWLADRDEEHFSYAVSATAALPFITRPELNSLLALAFDHLSPDVQMEAAWAAGKLGRESGIQWLVRACLDVNISSKAKQYLTELDREDAIPAAANDPTFQARSEFAQWLAHPNELGKTPDEVEVYDHRVLAWPPERERIPLWLLKYRVRDESGLQPDQVDVGLFGSVLFCLFSYKIGQRPPEDGYAIHCYWEMSCRKLITEFEVPRNSREYDSMLAQGRLDGVDNPRISLVAELSPDLKYPQKLVALASATRNGESGFVILDGPRSRWYAASEFPDDCFDKLVLMVHVGRVLLGFTDEPDRARYLKNVEAVPDAERLVEVYERILGQLEAEPSRAAKLMCDRGEFRSAFEAYVDAVVKLRSKPRAVTVCATYERMLAVADRLDPESRAKVHDTFTPLGNYFKQYLEALIELNRTPEVPALIERFRPYWKHNLGYGTLGIAAYRAGQIALAEQFFVTLRESYKDWGRAEEMDKLAEIWHAKGRVDDAHRLLIEAMRQLLEESRTATGSDRDQYEEWYQSRRSTFNRLFPERGDAELSRQGLARSTQSETLE
jgi:hypothetical protein